MTMRFVPGEVYSADWEEDGTYRAVKVLAVDEDAVHVRVYKERFSTRPATIDTDGLTLGSIDDADGFGVGHLPLTHEEFALWQPEMITHEEVRDDELDGYLMFKDEQDAEAFGTRRPTLLDRLRDWLGRRA